jgi:hypothetical protein
MATVLTFLGKLLLWPIGPLDRLWAAFNRRRFKAWQESQREFSGGTDETSR